MGDLFLAHVDYRPYKVRPGLTEGILARYAATRARAEARVATEQAGELRRVLEEFPGRHLGRDRRASVLGLSGS
jgi:hypothetical protein